MQTIAEELQDEIIAFMDRNGIDGEEEEAVFNALALRLFTYQYEHNVPYRTYCFQRGRTPRTVRKWTDIPAVPIQAFKAHTLSCSDPAQAEALFMTSGTTNPTERGRHYHPTLRVYDQSMLKAFRQFIMGEMDRVRMGILFPTEQVLPNSSLAHYLSLARDNFGAAGSAYLMEQDQIDLEALQTFLHAAEQDNVPVAILGATFSFVHVLDQLDPSARYRLPEGSFLLDTGGTKGKSREVEAELFYASLSERFGVPRESCINMYGMTELSSQFYDSGNSSIPSDKRGPHWIRTRAVDPLTSKDAAAGEAGILVHCDLANWNSVTTILTEDLGIMSPDGRHYRLMGRAQGSAARGCSLAAEAFEHAASSRRES